MTASPGSTPPSGPSTSTAATADAVAAAVLGVDGVVALHGGALGGLATYLPGRRVSGVRLLPGGAEVGVVVRFGTSIPDLSRQVRAVLTPIVGPAVTVAVGDLVAADESYGTDGAEPGDDAVG
ncbi:hypothetical protein GCM10027047_19870 [Rhodococcus aerolatus]